MELLVQVVQVEMEMVSLRLQVGQVLLHQVIQEAQVFSVEEEVQVHLKVELVVLVEHTEEEVQVEKEDKVMELMVR